MQQTIVRVFSEHFSSATKDFNDLQYHFNTGWVYVASNIYAYKTGFYTDYILQKN